MHLDVKVKLKLELKLKLMVRIMVVLMLRMRHVLFSAWNYFHWFPVFVTIGFAVFLTHIFHLLSLLGVLIAMWKRSRDFLNLWFGWTGQSLVPWSVVIWEWSSDRTVVYYSWTPVHVINLTRPVLIVVQTRAFGTHQTNTPFLPRWSTIYTALAKFSLFRKSFWSRKIIQGCNFKR